MPKKEKVLTKTLYTYVEPENRKYAIKQAKEKRIPGGYSGYINDLITADRKSVGTTRKREKRVA